MDESVCTYECLSSLVLQKIDFVPYLDANECANDPSTCGDGGTCQNIDSGNFYSCDCNDGFEGNGASASDGSLTCVGRFHLSYSYL